MLMMRHHGDDAYMTSQTIALQTQTSLFYKIDTQYLCILAYKTGLPRYSDVKRATFFW